MLPLSSEWKKHWLQETLVSSQITTCSHNPKRPTFGFSLSLAFMVATFNPGHVEFVEHKDGTSWHQLVIVQFRCAKWKYFERIFMRPVEEIHLYIWNKNCHIVWVYMDILKYCMLNVKYGNLKWFEILCVNI